MQQYISCKTVRKKKNRNTGIKEGQYIRKTSAITFASSRAFLPAPWHGRSRLENGGG